MNTFNSAPQPSNEPAKNDVTPETLDSIKSKLTKIDADLERVAADIKAATEGPKGPGVDGKLRALRNIFDDLTNQQTALSQQRSTIQRNMAGKFDLVQPGSEWDLAAEPTQGPRKERQFNPKNAKEKFGDGTIHESFRTDFKFNDDGSVTSK